MFRPDIEGLRALAVLAVLAFHFAGQHISGGFIGVDVFFVISGFLITRDIREDTLRGQFSFGRFYVRRIRRLFPALLFTIAAVLVAGIALSSPADLRDIGLSSIASIFSLSNFYFWDQSGYFDVAATQKPLLHTWSLGVEEQFYLLWPLLVVLLVTRLRRPVHAVAALAALGALSFWAAEFVMNRDAAGAFYLTPYRIGEFALGAICAFTSARPLPPRAQEFCAAWGLVLIFYAAFHYNEAMRFPGLSALLPCAGAALICLCGESRLSSALLGNRGAVYIGRISYSLYLAHWPLYVFALGFIGKPKPLEALALFAVSLLLAAFMYRYVEQPFRIRKDAPPMPARRFAMIFSVLAACAIALAAAMWWGEGWPWRYPNYIARYGAEVAKEKQARFDPYRKRCMSPHSRSCEEPADGVNVFVIGDSHAHDAFNALIGVYPHYHYVLNQLPACPPMVREDFGLMSAKHPDREACVLRNERLLYGNALAEADIVVINTMFGWYRPIHLERSLAQIRRQTQAPVIVLGNYVVFDEDVPNMIMRHGKTAMDVYYSKRLSKLSFHSEAALRELAGRAGFNYLSKRDLLCRGPEIEDCPLVFDDKLYTYDEHHLSLAAAHALGRAIRERHNTLFTRGAVIGPTQRP